MTTTTAPAPSAQGERSTLRRLYFVRSGFALVWAVQVFLTGAHVGVLTAVLLVLYPLVDVASAVVDARSARAAEARSGDTTGSAPALYANIAISTLAALALVLAITGADPAVPAVLRVWGVWAVVAGLVQLAVAIRRRALGGQWAMIASGSISVLAGISFALMATAPGASLADVAGYALLGGVFFLVSALRLGPSAGRRLHR